MLTSLGTFSRIGWRTSDLVARMRVVPQPRKLLLGQARRSDDLAGIVGVLSLGQSEAPPVERSEVRPTDSGFHGVAQGVDHVVVTLGEPKELDLEVGALHR